MSIIAKLHNSTININTVFVYGSRLYGCDRPDSDYDYICIVDSYEHGTTKIELTKHDQYNLGKPATLHLYTKSDFNRALQNHDVVVLEVCLLHDYLPKDFKIIPWKLRKSFSTVANHSWVKGKKKLTVSSDYDKLQGIKSVFHSIRILEYGIQIADTGNIQDKGKVNWLLSELYELADKYERDELWHVIYSRYHSLFKDLRHQFKIAAPKKTNNKKEMLRQVLESYNITPIDNNMIKQIQEIYE